MNVTSGYYFSTLGEVMKLRSVFYRPNKAAHKNAAFGIVYSTYLTPFLPAGEVRRNFWFLKFGSSLEAAIVTEAWDTPCIIWKSSRPGYHKIQVEMLNQEEGRPVTTYPIYIQIDTRLTIAFGYKKIMRVPMWHFQFSDITLRNISRAAGEEKYYLNGEPFKIEQIEELRQPANNLLADFLSEIL